MRGGMRTWERIKLARSDVNDYQVCKAYVALVDVAQTGVVGVN